MLLINIKIVVKMAIEIVFINMTIMVHERQPLKGIMENTLSLNLRNISVLTLPNLHSCGILKH